VIVSVPALVSIVLGIVALKVVELTKAVVSAVAPA
jgi:hypothetical protein